MANKAKQDLKRVSVEFFLAAARKLGANVSIKDVDKSGWYKVEGKTAGRKLYVPNSAEVGTIHLSGFRVEMPGVVDFDGPTNMVTQQVDFSAASSHDTLKVFVNVLKRCLFAGEGTNITLSRRTGGKKAVTPPSQEEIDKKLLEALGEEAEPAKKTEEQVDQELAELERLTDPEQAAG